MRTRAAFILFSLLWLTSPFMNAQNVSTEMQDPLSYLKDLEELGYGVVISTHLA